MKHNIYKSWAEPYKIKMVELLKMTTAAQRKKALQEALKQLSGRSTEELLATRYERLMSYGRFKEQAVS